MEQILQALDEVTRAYRDTRIHYCRLDAALVDGDRCALAGVALDQATLSSVIADLDARFPGVLFDASRVHVLRDGAQHAVVATNLTGLYAESSFLAEQISQLVNGCPLEMLMSEGRWCFVRLPDGYLGWTYGPYLADVPARAPTHIVCEPVSLLRAAPGPDARLVSRVLAGTLVVAEEMGGWGDAERGRRGAGEQGSRGAEVQRCGGAEEHMGAAYRRIGLAGDAALPLRPGLTGWAPAADLRALAELPQVIAARRAQIVADAERFIGVPYLWGGCAAFGIDCSGFVQLLHRLAGVIIPRDADMQFEAGQSVAEPFQPGDLVFFGEGEGRKITHIGISLGGWRIIHASRSRNGVQEDDVRAMEHLRESFVGARTFLSA